MLLLVLLMAVPLATMAYTSPTFTIQTIAGTGYVGDGAAATTAILSQPEGIVIDAAGNLYVADADDNRVRKISSDGVIQTFAGTGKAGFSGDGGPAVTAQLNRPYGMALDPVGNLYIADLGNGRIRKVSPDGTIQTVAGGGPLPTPFALGTQATQAELIAPRNVAIDLLGILYISDFGANQLYAVAVDGSIAVFAGTGVAGFAGDESVATLAQLFAPAGLICDPAGNLYLADSGNNRIREIAHGIITTVFTTPGPTGLAISAGGTLYVAASSYFGSFTLSLDSGTSARDVAVDASGNLYVTSGSLVQEFTVNGTVALIAGNGASRYYGGDGAQASLARLHAPSGIVLDDLGNTYIADTQNNRIRKILANGTMTTFAGTGDAGDGDGNGIGTMAQFDGPSGVAIDSLRNVYVADTGNNRICKIAPTGILTVIAGQLNHPTAVAIDNRGVLYIADTNNNRIMQVNPDGTSTILSAALSPAGLAIDVRGTLYISESNRVSTISAQGTLTTVVDGLNHPQGLAITGSGDLIVAETGTQRILLVHDGVSQPIAGTGAAGFSGDNGLALAAELDTPCGVALDSQNNIRITDSGNQRVRELIPFVSSTPVGVLSPVTVVNAASQAAGSIAPGEIVSIFGLGFDPASTQVTFDGKPATVFFTNATQINALVPLLVPGSLSDMQVLVGGVIAAAAKLDVVPAVPGLFLTNQNSGQAAAINQDGTYNSVENPAFRGSYLSLYATGWTDARLPVTVSVGGYLAPVLYAGAAPGFPGLVQVNIQIPGGFLGPGVQSVLLMVGTGTSQSVSTIALQ